MGVLPTDSRDEALRKETLVLAASVITTLAVVWVATYWALGLYWSAVIPFAYQVVSIISLAVFAKTKRYRFFRARELALSLLLPFVLQLSLGGFLPSSGVVLWSFTAPLGAPYPQNHVLVCRTARRGAGDTAAGGVRLELEELF